MYVHIQKGLIVMPLREEISLESMLAKINDSNIHQEMNFGINQGKESL